MRILILISAIILNIYTVIASDIKQEIQMRPKFIVVKVSEQNMNTRIMPPQNLLAKKSGAATFDVEYNGFSTQAQSAFQHAVDIWSTLISSNVTIKVIAYWKPLDENVLGSASASTLYRDFTNAPRQSTWYPIALAEKTYGSAINHADSADIVANFSSSFANWYFGIDGNTPAGKYDFVTVVLHELCHGLGFQGSMNISTTDNKGSWGYGSGYPFAFDHHAQNGSAQSLINTALFPNPSLQLAAQLIGQDLYFSGQNTNAANSGSPVRLYAPSTWESGSSYSHLNEQTFPAGNLNSLMTPSLGAAEAIHYPGDITLNMFKDMGWTVHFDPVSYTNVYPGDTDNNGIVNALDILPIGVYFLKQGYQRNESSFTWTANSAVIWDSAAATYADVNGDGVINEIDVIGIGINWNNSHNDIIESFEINPYNSALFTKYRSNFTELYYSLTGGNEAVVTMKTLLGNMLGIENETPKSFKLGKNYPNPFNPKTNIPFELPEKQRVTITIYNNLGQLMYMPVNNKLYDAGIYAYQLDAELLPSGIYFYSIKTQKFNESRKMVVLK